MLLAWIDGCLLACLRGLLEVRTVYVESLLDLRDVRPGLFERQGLGIVIERGLCAEAVFHRRDLARQVTRAAGVYPAPVLMVVDPDLDARVAERSDGPYAAVNIPDIPDGGSFDGRFIGDCIDEHIEPLRR